MHFAQFHHLEFHIYAKRLSKTGELGKEKMGKRKSNNCHNCSKWRKSSILVLALKGFVSFLLFVCVYSKGKSEMGATKGDCIVTEILSSLDIWQQVKKQNTDDNSISGNLSVPPLPKTDLPSQIPSFLV